MQTVRLKARIGSLQQACSVNKFLPLTCSRYPPPQRRFQSSREPHDEASGTTTPVPEGSATKNSKCPFYFEAGYAVFAKRRSRPFPPPFLSIPSGSFSDPLSTHNQSRDRRPEVNGDLIRGVTNGDDAVLVNENFVCANDGVGAWAQKEKGHAAYVTSSREKLAIKAAERGQKEFHASQAKLQDAWLVGCSKLKF